MNPESLREANPSVDWEARQGGVVRNWLRRLERWSLAVERLIGRIIRDHSLNPLYHTGTITVFLLVLLLVTGIYLTLFYQFGFDATYEAVAGIEENPLSRIIRAIHRYASAAALITAVIHAWRTFFMDRFRGARWLAWLTGVVSVLLVWLAGVTGYWMIWDATAGPLNQSLIDLLEEVPGGEALIVNLLAPGFAGTGWVFLVVVITAHLGVSTVIGVMLWYHLKRLNRARWMPPAHWMWVITIVLTVAAIAVPVGVLPGNDPAQRVGDLTVDLWFLAYLPAALRSPAVFWTGLLAAAVLAGAVPWLLRRRLPPPIVVDPERCTGCTLCFVDCPYNAVSMQREDGGELLAVVDAKRCVSCGICIGSCPPLAIAFDGRPPEETWPIRAAAEGAPVVYACERHLDSLDEAEGAVVPVTCVGAIHPDEVDAIIAAGAGSVRIVGCPPDDCAGREGNEWTEARLRGERRPRAPETLDLGRVTMEWRAPGGLSTTAGFREVVPLRQWRKLIPVSLLLGLLLAFQVFLTYVEVDAFDDDAAVIEIAMKHRLGRPIEGQSIEPVAFAVTATRLRVLVDGTEEVDRTETSASVTLFEQVEIPPGDHEVVVIVEGAGPEPFVVYREDRTYAAGEVVAVSIRDSSLAADPGRGENLFTTAVIRGGAGCRVCHSIREGDDGVGPSLFGVATRAETRVPGLSAEEYLRRSILDPDSYVVDGYPAGQMRAEVGEALSDDQLADLIAYLLTLR